MTFAAFGAPALGTKSVCSKKYPVFFLVFCLKTAQNSSSSPSVRHHVPIGQHRVRDESVRGGQEPGLQAHLQAGQHGLLIKRERM